jgi:hypothetical protein
MDNFKNHIDKLVSKVLNEEIENKVKQITETMSGEWTEIEVEEGLKGGQKKLDVAAPKGKLTSADFKKLRKSKEAKVGEKYGKNHGMEEQETEEGNAFSGALADAKKSGKDSFEVDGKKYPVKENKGSLKLTEDELIDMIEKIVMEQKVKDKAEKNNITKKTAQGLKDTDKVLGQNKKINDDHTKEVVKKICLWVVMDMKTNLMISHKVIMIWKKTIKKKNTTHLMQLKNILKILHIRE